MMRLIDADAFLEEAQNRIDMQDVYLPIHIKEFVIDEMPTIEAELVVRCKDCKYCNLAGDTWGDCHNPRFGDGWANYPPPTVDEDGYCAWGEKLGKEENETY